MLGGLGREQRHWTGFQVLCALHDFNFQLNQLSGFEAPSIRTLNLCPSLAFCCRFRFQPQRYHFSTAIGACAGAWNLVLQILAMMVSAGVTPSIICYLSALATLSATLPVGLGSKALEPAAPASCLPGLNSAISGLEKAAGKWQLSLLLFSSMQPGQRW